MSVVVHFGLKVATSCRSLFATVVSRLGGRLSAAILAICLLSHVCVLAYESVNDGPSWDEVGHFAAGLEHWQHRRFSLFSVNPPLVRLLATGPVCLMRDIPDPYCFAWYWGPGNRPEFAIGANVAEELGSRYFRLLGVARLSLIPFSVLGAIVCYLWAAEIWGKWSGVTAVLFWCFSPTVLAYGHLITPDLGAASMGCLALFSFRRWVKSPGFSSATLAGLTLGLAELTKATLLILFPLYLLLWFLFRSYKPERSLRKEGFQIVGIFITAVWLLNTGYGFEGTFQPLKNFFFISSPLGGKISTEGAPLPGNRFVGTTLGNIPVPIPANYLVGIDYMKWEFEHKEWSYLDGEWKLGGWWYYYIFTIVYKEPIALICCVLVAIALCLGAKDTSAAFREEAFLLISLVTLFSFVSSQTGFSHHIRYILPTLPLLFVWVSKLGGIAAKASGWNSQGRSPIAMLQRTKISVVNFVAGSAAIVLPFWYVFSSMSVFPHHMSYFNEIAGGPYNGYKHLDDSNLDWGQDLLYVKSWYQKHKEARPFHLLSDVTLIDPKQAGIDWYPVPMGQAFAASVSSDRLIGPQPGWFCISIKRINIDRGHHFDYFKDLTPVAWVGYTMPVYHITLAQANALRKKYGISLLN